MCNCTHKLIGCFAGENVSMVVETLGEVEKVIGDKTVLGIEVDGDTAEKHGVCQHAPQQMPAPPAALPERCVAKKDNAAEKNDQEAREIGEDRGL
jgi:hypothetical protein